jgi:hypothetical protein
MGKFAAVVIAYAINAVAAAAVVMSPNTTTIQQVQNEGAIPVPLVVLADRFDNETVNLPPTTTLAVRVDDANQRCPYFEVIFKDYGLEPVDTFSHIAYRESRCRIKSINAKFDGNGNVIWTLNKNGSIDRGLLQINSTWKTVTKNICGTDLDGLLILDCNLRVAKYLFDNGGLAHWKTAG